MKSCPRLRFRIVKPPFYTSEGVVLRGIEAHRADLKANDNPVGMVNVRQDNGGAPRVTYIGVSEQYQRCGVGTQLYERAAQLACKTFKKPLRSDVERSAMADGFWQKQVRKGRAVCLDTVSAREDDGYDAIPAHGRSGCYQYALLKCPAPPSLAGVRSRNGRKRAARTHRRR